MRTVQYYDSHLRSEAQIKYHLIRELCELMQKKVNRTESRLLWGLCF